MEAKKRPIFYPNTPRLGRVGLTGHRRTRYLKDQRRERPAQMASGRAHCVGRTKRPDFMLLNTLRYSTLPGLRAFLRTDLARIAESSLR